METQEKLTAALTKAKQHAKLAGELLQAVQNHYHDLLGTLPDDAGHDVERDEIDVLIEELECSIADCNEIGLLELLTQSDDDNQ